MSTRSYVVSALDGKGVGSYIHMDGYIEPNVGVAFELLEHFNTPEDALEVAARGHRSTLLSEEIYGDTDETRATGTVPELMAEANNLWCDYFYVHDGKNWYVSKNHSGHWKHLGKVKDLI